MGRLKWASQVNSFLISWSEKGDLVFDPMCGSGTTCKMAMINNRKYLGVDISAEYIDIAKKRLEANGRCCISGWSVLKARDI